MAVNQMSIAIAAEQHGGTYCLGGAPAQGCVDCSSWVNDVIGHVLGLPIPGIAAGKYDGSIHGPVVHDWVIWGGVKPISRGDVAGGDLVCWDGEGADAHMGIALSNQTMKSALNMSEGVKETPIARDVGPAGRPFVFRRLTGLALGGTTPIGPNAPTAMQGCNQLMVMAWLLRKAVR